MSHPQRIEDQVISRGTKAGGATSVRAGQPPSRPLLPVLARPSDAAAHLRVPAGDRISHADLDRDAVKVVNRLNYSGHLAYLVGGCVRDLLLGVEPKDFDVATNARPRQIKRLFNNSRIIGRRFRLVHVTFNGKALEVSTFRTLAAPEDVEDPLIRADNEFGEPHEDAWRRDFTVNGLFYDLQSRTVIDYVGGLEDLGRRVIRTIGNAWVRLREDPVRMLRAIKFAGRLGFHLADDLYEAILDCREDIRKAAPPRLLEEVLRLMERGGAWASVRLLCKTGLLDILLPEAAGPLRRQTREGTAEPFWTTLREIDRRALAGEPMPSSLLLACLLYGGIQDVVSPPHGSAPLSMMEFDAALEELLRPCALRLRVSRRDVAGMKQLFKTQRYLREPELKGRSRKRAMAMVARDYFPAALRFFAMRTAAEGLDPSLVETWAERLAAARSGRRR